MYVAEWRQEVKNGGQNRACSAVGAYSHVKGAERLTGAADEGSRLQERVFQPTRIDIATMGETGWKKVWPGRCLINLVIFHNW
jgi:hypothetical protein